MAESNARAPSQTSVMGALDPRLRAPKAAMAVAPATTASAMCASISAINHARSANAISSDGIGAPVHPLRSSGMLQLNASLTIAPDKKSIAPNPTAAEKIDDLSHDFATRCSAAKNKIMGIYETAPTMIAGNAPWAVEGSDAHCAISCGDWEPPASGIDAWDIVNPSNAIASNPQIPANLSNDRSTAINDSSTRCDMTTVSRSGSTKRMSRCPVGAGKSSRAPGNPTIDRLGHSWCNHSVRPRAFWMEVAGLGVGIVLTLTAVLMSAATGWPGDAPSMIASAITTLSWLAAGGAVAVVRPHLPFGGLLVGGGLFLASSGFLTALAHVLQVSGALPAEWVGWAGGWVFFPHLLMMCMTYLLFPLGTIATRMQRAIAFVALVATLVGTISLALIPGPLASAGPLAQLVNPLGGTVAAITTAGLAAACMVATMGAALVNLARNLRTLPSGLRAGTRVVLWLGAINLAIGILAVFPPGNWVYLATVPATMLLTAAIGIAAVLGPLWDLKQTLGRVLVYALLTLLTGSVFIGIVWITSAAIGNDFLGVPIASLLVCIGFAPMQQWLRTAIRRLLYGRNAEPLLVLTEFGQAVEAAGTPREALQRLCDLAKTTLKVPWIEFSIDASTVKISCGTEPEYHSSFPLHHHGKVQGIMAVGYRPGQQRFSAPDQLLLQNLARQASASAYSLALLGRLQHEGLKLSTAREDERRRIRRDLHDGVASRMTAVGLTLDVAELSIIRDADRCRDLLAKTRRDVSSTLNEVRRIIDGLGPSDVEHLGLAGALQALAERFRGSSLRITVRCGQGTDSIAEELAEASYWIASEAVHNAARHARATECLVDITVDGPLLRLTISDNGTGVATDDKTGIGIAGMQARAKSLGGQCRILASDDHGTSVDVAFPLAGQHE